MPDDLAAPPLADEESPIRFPAHDGPSNWVNANGNTTVKWRGRSLTAWRSAYSQAADAAAAARVAERAVSAADQAMREAIAPLLGLDADRIHLGGHECPESPTLACIYDDETDTSHDVCVICGESSERK